MKTMPLILVGLVSSSLSAFAATPPAKENYVAHEWGTFTSVQGADGIQLEWNPFTVTELPKFVYTVFNPTGRQQKVVLPVFQMPGKSSFLARQRMETPVIYFYSDEARKVDVEVNFPDGRITEWYPQLANPRAQAGVAPARPVSVTGVRAAMRWGDVEILPGNGSAEAAKFPKDETGSHYYAARETDAAALRVKTPDGTEQHEKFLFYRGLGQFDAPLKVSHWGDNAESVRLENTSAAPLGPFFVYAVRGNKAALVEEPVLDAKVMDDKEFKFDKIARPIAEVRAELAAKLRAALTNAGLYEKEAAAMVKTWDDSWLGEQGTRVLYLLPQKWSDTVLPLTITPAPKEVKRVFVGRAEIITPAQEFALLKEAIHFTEGGSLEKKAALAAVADIGLGRFGDAAVRHLTLKGPASTGYSQALWGLLEATRPRGVTPQPPAWAEANIGNPQPVIRVLRPVR
jgi:hypothetical protein